MARKKKPPEHINQERWLVSYADFITLLFAFFTSLYAISTEDSRKVGKLVFSTRAAFNMDFFPSDKPLLGFSSTLESLNAPNSMVVKQKVVTNELKKKDAIIQPPGKLNAHSMHILFEQISTVVQKLDPENIHLKQSKNGFTISLNSAALFEPASANIRPESYALLNTLIRSFLDYTLMMRVEGHTDDSPTIGSNYASNWELSVARAISVMRYLINEHAYPPELLSVAGYASYKPLEKNDTKAGRSINRRVDFVILASEDPSL